MTSRFLIHNSIFLIQIIFSQNINSTTTLLLRNLSYKVERDITNLVVIVQQLDMPLDCCRWVPNGISLHQLRVNEGLSTSILILFLSGLFVE